MKKDLMWGLKALAQMLVLGTILTLVLLTIRWWGPVILGTLCLAIVVIPIYITVYELRSGKRFPKTDAEIY